jgi:pilus assembly protein Flp/PilA
LGRAHKAARGEQQKWLQAREKKIMNDLKPAQLYEGEQGAASIEYATLASLIAAVIVAVVVVLGTQINAAFCTFSSNFSASC